MKMMPVIAKTAPPTNPAMSPGKLFFSSSTFAAKTSIGKKIKKLKKTLIGYSDDVS